MPTQIITLKDGIRIEADVSNSTVAAGDGLVDETIDSVKPTLVRVMQPVAEAWSSLPAHMQIEQAEVEIAFGFEASGSIFVASTKGNVNLKVKLTIKRNPAQAVPDR